MDGKSRGIMVVATGPIFGVVGYAAIGIILVVFALGSSGGKFPFRRISFTFWSLVASIVFISGIVFMLAMAFGTRAFGCHFIMTPGTSTIPFYIIQSTSTKTESFQAITSGCGVGISSTWMGDACMLLIGFGGIPALFGRRLINGKNSA